MTREELANWLCDNVWRRRLKRIGEPVPDRLPRIGPLHDMPEAERQNWLDMADAVVELQDPFGEGQERLDAIDKLVRMIVEMDLPGGERITVPRREMLIGHLTGALFVREPR